MPFDLDPSRIDDAETKLGIALPAAYRASMARANGGCVDDGDDTWTLYPIFDDSDIRRLKRTANDIVRETKEARAHGYLPLDGIAIGSNESGDLLVLMPKENDPSRAQEAVYRWDHETMKLQRVAVRFEAMKWDWP